MAIKTANNKRIAKNTLFLYIRMLILLLVNLYTARIVLDKLGIEDYGIYNVVAGFVVMLAFFSSSMSNVTQRFLTIELGKGDGLRARQIFNQHLLLYILIIAGVCVVAETGGLYFVAHKLVIPTERIDAAIWAYQFALVSLGFTLLGIVFNSAIIAHEDMKVYSYVGIAEGLAKLATAYVIGMTTGDRLIVYAFLLMSVAASAQMFYAYYCYQHYKECRYLYYWDRSTIMQTTSFVGWNFVGTIIYMLKDQGVNMLLNLFYGPVVNAARAVSFQVNGAITNFNANFFTSVRPQLMKSYASGDNDYMKQLFFKSTKYSLFLLWLLCFPVMLHIDTLLGVWLKEVPEYTAVFTVWVLVDSILASMTNAPWTIIMATGNLRRYVIYSNGILLLIFPLCYVTMKSGASPVSVFIIIVCVRILHVILTVYISNQQIDFGFKRYVINVLVPAAKVLALTLPLLLVVQKNGSDGLPMSIIFILAECMYIVSVIVACGATSGERAMFLRFLRKRYNIWK